MCLSITDLFDLLSQVLNKLVNNDGTLVQTGMEENEGADFTVDDLTLLKEIFLSLEKAVDDIVLPNALGGGGETFTGGYIFTLLEKANVSKTIKTLFCIATNRLIVFFFLFFQKTNSSDNDGKC